MQLRDLWIWRSGYRVVTTLLSSSRCSSDFRPVVLFYFLLFQSSPKGYVFTVLKEGERERGETLMWEKNINRLPPISTRPRVKPATFWCTGLSSNQLSHTGQGQPGGFKYWLIITEDISSWLRSPSFLLKYSALQSYCQLGHYPLHPCILLAKNHVMKLKVYSSDL